MSQNQGEFFLKGEGDSWFRRNLASKSFEEASPVLETEIIRLVGREIKKLALPILEVGASRGDRIYRMSRALCLEGIAVDPSTEAITQGELLFSPKVRFRQGLASAIPIEEKSVGLVFFGFCLYLTNGIEVEAAAEEAWRTLGDGGFVAIFDFDSPEEIEIKYEHLEPLLSHRRAYGPLMERHGFTLISKTPFSHAGGADIVEWDSDPMERTALWIFTK